MDVLIILKRKLFNSFSFCYDDITFTVISSCCYSSFIKSNSTFFDYIVWSNFDVCYNFNNLLYILRNLNQIHSVKAVIIPKRVNNVINHSDINFSKTINLANIFRRKIVIEKKLNTQRKKLIAFSKCLEINASTYIV